MDPDRWQRVSKLFEAAVELPEADRPAWVRARTTDDPELTETLLRMLREDASGQLLDRSLGQVAAAYLGPPDPAPVLAPSERIGDYEILGILGRGGMGVVYRARDIRLDRIVALKFLPAPGPGSAAVSAIEAEARAASALDHPNIATIYHVGAAPDGRPFLAMACYEGQTLAERLANGPLPPAEAVRIATAVAAGLAAAHARGIVHRDVKPANVFLTAGGGVKLLDFGIAAAAGHQLDGRVRGTLRYMSPEQSRATAPHPRSDVWSLGAVLYETLAGAPPFDAPLPKRGVSAELRAIVDQALSRDPETRFSDAGAMLTALEHAAGPRSRTLVVVGTLFALAVLTVWIASAARSASRARSFATHLAQANFLLARRTPEAVAQAIGEYEAALAIDSTNATVLANAGYAYTLVVDWGWPFRGRSSPELRAEARRLSDRAMAQDSTSAAAWLTRAYLLSVEDPYKLRGAVEAFTRAMALDSTNAEGWYQFGQSLQTLGRFDEAAQAYRRAFKLDPNRPMIYMSLSAISQRQGRIPDARALIDSAVAASKTVTSPYVRAARGSIALMQGDLRLAHDEADLAVALDTAYAIPARSLLVRVLVAEGHRDLAEAEYEKARRQLGSGPPSPTAAYFLARALVALGRRSEALDVLEQARPRSANLWFYLVSQDFDPIRADPRFQKVYQDADPNRP